MDWNTLWKTVPWGKILAQPAGLAGEQEITHVRRDDGPKPGCVAAYATIEVLGCLEGLADGLGGFGLLSLERKKLEAGAEAAEEAGRPDIGDQMREIAQKLPTVRSAEAAADLARELKPVRDRAWRLGRACGLTRRE